MAQAVEIKSGMVIELDGDLFRVVSHQHQKYQNRRPVVTLKIKNIKTGAVLERKFSSSDRVEMAHVERQPMEYIYSNGERLVFMNPETYDQIEVDNELLADQLGFLKENTPVELTFHEGQPVSAEMPPNVVLKVEYTEPALKKSTATNVFKPAKLETGVEVSVPGFIEIGEKIKVDTRTGKYVERA